MSPKNEPWPVNKQIRNPANKGDESQKNYEIDEREIIKLVLVE